MKVQYDTEPYYQLESPEYASEFIIAINAFSTTGEAAERAKGNPLMQARITILEAKLQRRSLVRLSRRKLTCPSGKRKRERKQVSKKTQVTSLCRDDQLLISFYQYERSYSGTDLILSLMNRMA